MSDYLADDQDQPITEAEFTRRACDPRSSAVVEACAGSGKTWLLVSRIVRLLLAGAKPGEILAITFTRRAAQEMRSRLLQLLKDLANGSEDEVATILRHRGVSAVAARDLAQQARCLYEQVLTARVPLTIETFHGWFWQLITRAPLGSGVPFAPVLLEATDRLRADAWLHFSAALMRPDRAVERSAWEWLIDEEGDVASKKLLLQFLDKRAEWWSFAAGDDAAAVERALEPMQVAGDTDPDRRVREAAFVQDVESLTELWRAVGKPGTTIEQAIDRAQKWLGSVPAEPARDFRDACLLLLTKSELTPIIVLQIDRIAPKLATAAQAQRYADAHARVVAKLQELLEARRTWRALKLNEAGLCCGRLLIDSYQRLKAQQQGLDFTDLEWHAHRLLADPDHAAYMQARLDARYRHILLDEFQDTNPLQWQVLRSWFEAYGARESGSDDAPDVNGPAREATDRPTVFVVGDPKQSIYRFRRAEPRVFEAAGDLLRRDFGAARLRTNVTRRNPKVLMEVLNRALPGRNPLYQPQRTLAVASGAFVLLPLVEPEPHARADEGDAALRDVLTTPRAERDSEVRYREGRVLANEIAHWVGQVKVEESDELRGARWSDVILLVRKRAHLPKYERALRDAGVPFVSDRRGGLLATLEADDLIALLEFLTAPMADLKLAQALRSPILDCNDEDLMQLAAGAGESWWKRLLGLPEPTSPALARARRLLQRWLELAGVLPMHDLLDRIYFEADVRRRYAALVPDAMHDQVQANLDAFIELALAVDAGRYPSLPRFIEELAALRQHAGNDAPDEGVADAGDAVRVMTIHGAKGLEAEIVVLADAHAREPSDAESVLVVWPPESAVPEHVSLVARGAKQRDEARSRWFDADDEQKAQEDWNLLYVAATRARQVLIVSGCQPVKGELADSWYTRLQCAADLSPGAAAAQPKHIGPTVRNLRDFRPEPLPTGERSSVVQDSDSLRLGRAWHAMLELGPAAPVAAIARAYSLTAEQAQHASAAAVRVRARLPQFFSGRGDVELELMTDQGKLLRVDRLVESDEAVWIIDFKWRVTDGERAAYEAQVQGYAEVLRSIRRDKPVRMALVTSDGWFVEVSG